MAGDLVGAFGRAELRGFLSAAVGGLRAAVVEGAAGGALQDAWHFALDRHGLALGFDHGVRDGDGGQKGLGPAGR